MIDKIRLAAGISLGVFAFVVAGVYGYFFFLNTRAVAVDTRVQAVVNQIQEKADVEVLYRRLADIVQEADALIATRQDYAGVLLDVYRILPASVAVEGVRFEGNTVIVDVRAFGVQNMSQTLVTLENIDTEERFSTVTMESVRRADDGNYFIRIRLGLATS